MNTLSRKLYVRIAAIALVLSFFGLSARAESPREQLVHAFHLLKKADRDYAGHREIAMHEVEVAGHELGLELGGELPDREHQWKSDAQMMEARRLLKECRNKLEREDRDRVASHVEKAIREIDMALEVK